MMKRENLTRGELTHGIRANLDQFLHQLLQVMLVGFTIGMMRTVVPALSESEFGVPKNSFMLLTAFVVAFGFVKGSLNFVAGRLSERIGRKKVLLLGWSAALPIPLLVYFAPSWSWIVAATVLLGINQGLTWSMTQTSKLDITRSDQRGLTIGLNEFAGYVGLALAGIITAYLATILGARTGLLIFGLTTISLAILLTLLWVKDTLPWAKSEAAKHKAGISPGLLPRYPANISAKPATWEVFTLVSWRDKRLAAISQAGLVEKFVDALVWVFYPVFLYQRGLSLPDIGWVVGVYGFVWGGSQFFTGKLSDHIGRHKPNVWGMWICGAGVAMMLLGDGMVWWSISAAITGFGMALLYPNLSAAIADISHPNWRGSAIGIYRFWRDLGYGIGALGLGITAHFSGKVDTAFWFVAISMFISGGILWLLGEETHPRINPAAVSPAPTVTPPTLEVRVISQTPPGGRCGLYTGYGQALAQHLGSRFQLDISTERDAHGHGFPSIWINGSPLRPSDGVIVMPEDVVEVLVANKIMVSNDLGLALIAEVNKMLHEGG
jgi:MFS family permease